jgi:hypothetical protein
LKDWHFMGIQVSKVSLFGVSRNALLLSRACALKDNPILGVYDPDPQNALRAALFLGVSARRTSQALFGDQPDVVLCSLPVPDAGSDALIIRLGPKGNEPAHPNVCWADAGLAEDDSIPDQISNELPRLELTLEGTDDAIERAKSFFQALSSNIVTDSKGLPR